MHRTIAAADWVLAPPRKGRLLAVLLAGQFMANVDTAIANVATPSIHERLGASGAELQLTVSGYVLAYAMLLITAARLGDLRGYRRVYVLGVAVFTAASLVCGLAPTPLTLVLARVGQGAGAALLVAQVLSGIQLHFEGAERQRALGRFVVVLSTSAVIGQILGGLLISADLLGAGWRPIFLINVPIGAALLVAALRWLPPDAGARTARMDLAGVAALSATVLLIVLPLVLGQEAGWPGWTWLALAASLPGLAVFVAIERRVAGRGGQPLLDLGVLVRPAVGLALASRAAAMGTYFGMLFVLALYLQQARHESAWRSGLALVSWVAAFGVGGPLLGRLPARLARLAAPIGAMIMGGSYLAMATGAGAGEALGPALVTLLGLGGLGFGINTAGLLSHLTGAVPRDYAPDISGVYQTTGQLAGVMGVAGFGALYLALTHEPGLEAATHAFTVICAAFALAAGVAAAAAWGARALAAGQARVTP
jgi:MFS family permease